MKPRKSKAARRRDTRAIDDLSVPEVRAKDAKGGFLNSAISTTVKSIGDGLSTVARKG